MVDGRVLGGGEWYMDDDELLLVVGEILMEGDELLWVVCV